MTDAGHSPSTGAQPLNREERRPDDPGVVQRRVSVPEISAWVNASAGTGKTKVLTDRVLRLLLPRSGGEPGTPPHKILCLTYTKAAAAEMALRINAALSSWAVAEDSALQESLKKISGSAPSPDMMTKARQLFVKVLDAPGGLPIMTIHSFCQSVLGRFPLEAGLPPHFHVVEEDKSAQMLQQAMLHVTSGAAADADSALSHSVRLIRKSVAPKDVHALIAACRRHGTALKAIMENHVGEGALHAALCHTMELDPKANWEDSAHAFCRSADADAKKLAALLEGGSAKDKEIAQGIAEWLAAAPDQRFAKLDAYYAVLSTEGRPRVIRKKSMERYTEAAQLLNQEVQRLNDLFDLKNAYGIAAMTAALLTVGYACLKNYETLKAKAAALDYNDLIERTRTLITGKTAGRDNAPWVLFKLDGGLDHILIDEAQDTNPAQWEIVSKLLEEFTSGAGQSDVERTLFVVGDEKQSIYSFQGAAPEMFERMRTEFKDRLESAEKKLVTEDMITSFRSTKTVLSFVDDVLSLPEAARGLGHHIKPHTVHRRNQAGRVELWPLFRAEKKGQEVDGWAPPLAIAPIRTPGVRMAESIAATIEKWLENEEILESSGRPIRPGDILILVRTRTALVAQIVKALKTRSIPVSGIDRLVLNKALVVQDLLALGQTVLLPLDDLTLATVLKSPLIGLSEEALFDMCAGRSASVRDVLNRSRHTDIAAYLDRLEHRAARVTAYDFYNEILQAPCPAHAESGLKAILSRLGEDCLDPLDEFLNSAILHERDGGGDLSSFIHETGRVDAELKREMENAAGAVRIMTIHAAKGLEAPIVFLPDTLKTNSGLRGAEKLIWPQQQEEGGALPLPLYASRKDLECKAYSRLADQQRARQEEEYNRLFYVALTRARDRLILMGAENGKPAAPASWYALAEAAFALHLDVLADPVTGIKTLYSPQEAKPEEDADMPARAGYGETLPDWLHRPVKEETPAAGFLRPSRPVSGEPGAASPLLSARRARGFYRGTVIHTLLQTLPDVAQKDKRDRARAYLSLPAHGWSAQEQEEMETEVMAVLEHSAFAPVFGPGSLPEVAVTGRVDEQTVISGQIDRLLVTDKDVLIVDFKTHRPPPEDAHDIPPAYRQQLYAYRRLMEKIYPGRAVRTALIWTHTATLMEIADYGQ